ncbi:hypothetical protein HB790_03270 [Listeria welshimeri]|uniref:Uncharacterized protein n=2 Tax=Listeria welshimeri TaxID=1643 RepID=A0ABX4IH13_LISWE|nr:hypothetical protein [Listeria welshimeri]MBC1281874.1 hypothetical protein [Listeria welshimeri]MBC1354348.1 hypothetical protein [Listeria welshimeri]MBC1409222.1 hypothetical protein [Listeria welshimeri]MBC1412283.1 hypothetical protein [Listeria welshimeri]MBC1451170.1 hypothetical protein [Listeria welshimeri]
MKADAIQLTILMENTNIARTSPAKLVQFYSEYLQYIMKQNFQSGIIDKEFFLITDDLLKGPNKFFVGEITSDDFFNIRIKAWMLHDAEGNVLRKSILRAIVSCLYEKSSETNSSSENYMLIELYLSLLLDINEVYCKQFRIFLEEQINAE